MGEEEKKGLGSEIIQQVIKYLSIGVILAVMTYFGQKLLKSVDQSDNINQRVEKLSGEITSVTENVKTMDKTVRTLEVQSVRLTTILERLDKIISANKKAVLMMKMDEKDKPK